MARWLLHVHDRLDGDVLRLTQETRAEFRGVQRTTVTMSLRAPGVGRDPIQPAEFDRDRQVTARSVGLRVLRTHAPRIDRSSWGKRWSCRTRRPADDPRARLQGRRSAPAHANPWRIGSGQETIEGSPSAGVRLLAGSACPADPAGCKGSNGDRMPRSALAKLSDGRQPARPRASKPGARRARAAGGESAGPRATARRARKREPRGGAGEPRPAGTASPGGERPRERGRPEAAQPEPAAAAGTRKDRRRRRRQGHATSASRRPPVLAHHRFNPLTYQIDRTPRRVLHH